MLAPAARSVSPPEWRVVPARSAARSESRKVSANDVFSESESRPVPVSIFSWSSISRLSLISVSVLSPQSLSFSPTLVWRSESATLLARANSFLLPGFRSVSVSAKRSSWPLREAMRLLLRAESAIRSAWAISSVPASHSLLVWVSAKPLSFLLVSPLPFSISPLASDWAIFPAMARPSCAFSEIPRASLHQSARGERSQ